MKLKLSEITTLEFPKFEEINIWKNYGSKFFRFWVDHWSRDPKQYSFRGTVCGLSFSAPYTPEGLKQIEKDMNEARIRALIGLNVVEE